MTAKEIAVKDLQKIPGVGKSIANDLWNIGMKSVADLKNKNPERLYDQSNRFAGTVQDPCLLYVFRCAVYFASNSKHEKEKLKWWNWKDRAGRPGNKRVKTKERTGETLAPVSPIKIACNSRIVTPERFELSTR